MVPLRPTAADLAFESVATLPARRPPMLPVGDPAFLASEPRKCLHREGPPELDLPCRLWATFRDCPSRILGPPCRTVELSCSRIPGLVPDVLSARDAEQVLPCRLRATFRDCPSRILGPSCRTVELSCSRIPGLVPDDLRARDAEQDLPCRLRATCRDCPSRAPGLRARCPSLSALRLHL